MLIQSSDAYYVVYAAYWLYSYKKNQSRVGRYKLVSERWFEGFKYPPLVGGYLDLNHSSILTIEHVDFIICYIELIRSLFSYD